MLKNFPTLSSEVYETPWNKSRMATRLPTTQHEEARNTNGIIRNQIETIMERILKASDVETLIARIVKTIELHNSIPDKNGSSK